MSMAGRIARLRRGIFQGVGTGQGLALLPEKIIGQVKGKEGILDISVIIVPISLI